MTTRSRFLAACLAGLATHAAPALAQVNTGFTYQGELRVDGAPAPAGVYDLEACVYAAPSGGSPLGCTAPINDLPIAEGRFTVVLDAGNVFDGSTRYLELRVRLGNESTPHVALQPRQAIRPTPQAQYAARAPFTGLVGIPASLLDGDDAGVTQVTAGAGLSGGTITTTGTLAIANGGVTSAMLAPNAVGAAQVNPDEVQLRISGTCAEGEYFRGFNANGTPACELLPVTIDRAVEAGLRLGEYARMVLRADDRPLIAYHEESSGQLRLYDCANPACSSGVARQLATGNDAGEGIAMVLRPDGRPLIAYLSDTNDTLSILSCDNTSCTSATTTVLDSPVAVGHEYVDIALRADGRAVLAYRKAGGTFWMASWHCANVDCTSGSGRTHMTVPTNVAIAMRPDGRPLLAAGGNGGAADSPRFWDCGDADCTTGTLRPTTSVQYQQVHGMAMRSNGRALLLTFSSGGAPSIVSCNNENCTATQVTQLPLCPLSQAGHLALRPGGGLVVACSYYDSGILGLAMHDCSTTSCTSGSSRPLLPPGRAGRAVAIAVRSDNRPVIAYHDQANDDVRLYVCATPGCP